jgi:Domain of unknown function (DUF4340)
MKKHRSLFITLGVIVAAILVMVTLTVYGCASSPNQAPPATHYVLNFDMYNLQNLTITLPKVNASESFVKHSDDQEFYFDVANGVVVDNQRWGGAIPALLSGPAVGRMIQQNASTGQLQQYGLDATTEILNLDAKMTFLLSGTPVNYEIYIGDSNPEGTTYYIRLASNNDVYTVDKSWYDVLADIVTNPPYIQATLGIDTPTVSSVTIAIGATEIIQVNITDNGNVTGSFNVNLLINGNLVSTKAVTLNSQATKVVTFQVVESMAGEYVASINQGHNTRFAVQ